MLFRIENLDFFGFMDQLVTTRRNCFRVASSFFVKNRILEFGIGESKWLVVHKIYNKLEMKVCKNWALTILNTKYMRNSALVYGLKGYVHTAIPYRESTGFFYREFPV